jgi:hypothetical protein
MSRAMNPGPPGRYITERADAAERRAGTGRQPTLIREVDLLEPLPAIGGGVVTRTLLLIRVGAVAVGSLLLVVPSEGLPGAELGAAIAARIGARRRRPQNRDTQTRSRSRGRMSSA